MAEECLLCRGAAGDADLFRTEVWADEWWRLTTVISGDPAPGFSYLEPRRHISDITALDGVEAASFGGVLAHCSQIVKEATDAELTYIYVFGGGIAHLHVHLAPHREGDAWNDVLVKGPITTTTLPSGAELQVSADYPPLSDEDLRQAANQIRDRLVADPPATANP